MPGLCLKSMAPANRLRYRSINKVIPLFRTVRSIRVEAGVCYKGTYISITSRGGNR